MTPNNENEVQWNFRKMSPSEINQDPVEREFFGDEPINVRLAREVIQNSLDASIAKKLNGDRTQGPPVKVRFSLEGLSNPLPADKATMYFRGLSEHLAVVSDLEEDSRIGAEDGTLIQDSVPYIVIEDAGTTGLCGDTAQFDDTDDQPASDNDFYWFFRNVGRSGKGATDNGSWGLGKWVMPDVSEVSTYIALTKTDRDLLLMGQSILKKHTIGGERFASYGYLSVLDDNGLSLPLSMSRPEHRSTILKFICDFDIRFRHERGLSVVIPFPRIARHEDGEDGANAEKLVAAVVHNYFYPIVNGWLEVTVERGGGNPITTIGANTIDEVVERLNNDSGGEWSKSSYKRLFAMVRKTQWFGGSEYVNLTSPPETSEDYKHATDIQKLRTRYESNELIPIRIATKVTSKQGERFDTGFNVFLQRLDDLNLGHDYYIRGTLSIPEMDFIKSYRALALVVVEENECLAAMLRDSEAPAHTTWRINTDRVNKRWRGGPSRIREVRNSVKNLLTVLETQAVGLQKDAFADLFTIDTRNVAQDGGSLKRKKTTKAPVPRLPRAAFGVSDVLGGFNIRFNRGEKLTSDRALLQVAYEMPRSSNPLKVYKPLDFHLHGDNALTVEHSGCKLTPGEEFNQLNILITDAENFSISVRGFDEHRDLYVRLDPIVEKQVKSGDDEDDPQS